MPGARGGMSASGFDKASKGRWAGVYTGRNRSSRGAAARDRSMHKVFKTHTSFTEPARSVESKLT